MGTRGSIVAGSYLRGEKRYMHTPILDPTLCMCAGPHTCYSEAGSEWPGLVEEVRADRMVVHHYVEMLSRNIGRCAKQHKACNVEDASAVADAVPFLQSLEHVDSNEQTK